MRKRSGFIVRFVDVVLILLFGFINISNIRQTDVVLPTSSEALLLPPDTDEVVYVGVDSNGKFVASEELRLESPDKLKEYLTNVFESDKDLGRSVRILAMYDAPMRSVQTAVMVCTELGVSTSLAVRLANRSRD